VGDKVSFTGSERIGKIVGSQVQQRFGKVLLELVGNNGTFPPGTAFMSLPE
jgi:aldehyde dehydrogenase family 7 protein A1